MEAVTGIFLSQKDAERAVRALRMSGVASDRITFLTPGDIRAELESAPVDATEQPGMGKALGTLVGAVGGFSSGSLLFALVVPGVGLVTAAGLLGSAILAAAGAGVGAATGEALENSMTHGVPEDEIFVYEDALRRGRTVVVVLGEDAAGAERIRERFKAEGAEAVDAARHQWWIGLRSAELEHYSASGRNFDKDEKFYRMGFEAALHARTRCMEFDQVSAEMDNKLEELQQQYPGVDLEEPFTRGYQRGREYYQRLCDQSKAA